MVTGSAGWLEVNPASQIRYNLGSVLGDKKERWLELCEKAAVEHDPKRLLDLVKEISDLLEEKERRLGIIPPQLPKLRTADSEPPEK